MRTIDLALKDLRQVFRDRRALIFLLVMPVVFTLFFGFAFKPKADAGDTRLKIGVVNRDPEGVLSKALVELIDGSETIRVENVAEKDSAQIDSRVVQGDLAAGLIIPQGFTEAALRGEGTLNGSSVNLEIINNEETANGETARRGLQTMITRAIGMAQTAQISLKAYEAKAGVQDAAARQTYLQDAVASAGQAWKAAPLSIRAYDAANAAQKTDPNAGNPYNQFSPGMMVMFSIFGLTSAAMVMVSERKNGVMARLLTTPMTRPELIGGHILGLFLVFFGQQLLLMIFGQLVLKVDYFRQPVAALLMTAALSLWVAAFGLLISALVKKEEQVVLYAMVGMFLFSALGGSWFSLEMVGKTFATIGHLTPTAWAMDGMQNIIMRGMGLEAVLLPAGVIVAYAAAFFGVAIWKFRVE